MTTIKDLLEDWNMSIKPQLEEILSLLKKQQANSVTSSIEAAAAKIITDLKMIIQDCPCNKEILVAFKETQKEKEIIVPTDGKKFRFQPKYSYPNYGVGNEELGTGKSSNSLTWPFGVDKGKST